MNYSIREVSDLTKLTIPTIRYYESEGILPPVKRNESGNRVFNEDDIEWLNLICCLRSTGMPVRNIKKFVQWSMEGDESIDRRIDMLIEHEKYVNEQLDTLNHYKNAIGWKINYFKGIKKEIDSRNSPHNENAD